MSTVFAIFLGLGIRIGMRGSLGSTPETTTEIEVLARDGSTILARDGSTVLARG